MSYDSSVISVSLYSIYRIYKSVIITPLHYTRCYFNVRSKADMSQLNLPHTTIPYHIRLIM